jgi:L-lactate dehydrogenase
MRNVHSFIIGEHGDSEIVTWSFTNIAGVPINKYCEFKGHYKHEESMEKIANEVKNSAYEIIDKKKATYYGIAMSVRRICEVIVRDEKTILPVSSIQNENYNLGDVALSMPRIVGKDGLETFAPIELADYEVEGLKKSAEVLKATIKNLNI